MSFSIRVFLPIASVFVAMTAVGADDIQNWPSFRGDGGRGVADEVPLRTSWNADPAVGALDGILWKTPVPGISHSSPVVWEDKIFLCTAISKDGKPLVELKSDGKPTAADDNGEHSWVVLCYDRLTGDELWRKTARTGIPRATHHVKATHADSSVAVDGKYVVAFFGSEGLYCYDLDGELLWKRDLGIINISKYGIGWGYASSPAIHDNRIALICDDPENPFVVVLRLSDGEEIWRVSRKGVSDRNWSTPLIHEGSEKTQVVVNGWPWVVSYDLENGDVIWRIEGGGDNPVPTPFEANGWIYITSAHGKLSPIYVVRPEAQGDITPSEDAPSSEAMVWSILRGGSYMSTPVVYGDNIYLGHTKGTIGCFNAKTGEERYKERLANGAAITSSLVAADGKIYCPSENGTVYVLAAGDEFEILAENAMSEPCMATPAVVQGVIYFRTAQHLVAIQ
jgi:outer membrane protein assembly factor BamB